MTIERMQRHSVTRRHDWQSKVETAGLTYHTHESGPYWDESGYYSLNAGDVATLETAANTLHKLCLDAADAVIQRNWWSRLAIPEAAIPVIRNSWERDDFSIYGRFDLAYDGRQPPKLLEYNADTPTALVEAAVAQWFWLRECQPAADQFNSIHERLIAAWKRRGGAKVHFASVRDHPEDEQTVTYLQDTCLQAGIATERLYLDEIGWSERDERFVDLKNEPVLSLFKLYPWEWMWQEDFAPMLPAQKTRFIEPAWKMLLSNKGLLPVLWELFPGHPNLLPCYETAGPLNGNYARKPKLSREGANVTLVEHGRELETNTGDYGAEGFVYQALAPIPDFNRHHPVMGVWIVDHEAAGLGIREDTRRITGNFSRFVPHMC